MQLFVMLYHHSTARFLAKHASAADWRTVKCIGYFNAVPAVACMYNLTAADINCYMADGAAAAIENQVTRLQL